GTRPTPITRRSAKESAKNLHQSSPSESLPLRSPGSVHKSKAHLPISPLQRNGLPRPTRQATLCTLQTPTAHSHRNRGEIPPRSRRPSPENVELASWSHSGCFRRELSSRTNLPQEAAHRASPRRSSPGC